jgi:hypothetical protein
MIRAVQRHAAASDLVVFMMRSIRLQLFIDQFPCVTSERSFR